MSENCIKLNDEQRVAWLQLIRSENVGPVAFRSLINRYGGAREAIAAIPELVRRGGGRKIKIAKKEDIEREILACRKFGAQMVFKCEPGYPKHLLHLHDAPPVLTIKGSLEIFNSTIVAIVGSRNSSAAGMKFAKDIAHDLCAHDYKIISGFARGIDSVTHWASIKSGTIAVFAGGIDQLYPPENKNLMHEVINNGGAIISEAPFGYKPIARDFPRRNRIIAGTAVALVVVEAAKRSGSLITAKFANELGRLVFAVPGSPLDPRAYGTNYLLRQGAMIVTQTEDILEGIRPLTAQASEFKNYGIDEDQFVVPMDDPIDGQREQIVSALSTTPVRIDEIISCTNAHPGNIHMVLLELELAGRLERHTGNLVSLQPV